MRKFCCILSIILCATCVLFACNSEEYYFYLLDKNYSIFVEESICIKALKINTNIDEIENYNFSFNSQKVKIEDNNIIALEEGSIEIKVNIKANNKIYSDYFILEVLIKEEPKITANYLINNINENINCLVLAFNNFEDRRSILNSDIFNNEGFISVNIIALKVDVFYYKNSKFEDVLSEFLLSNNFKNISNLNNKN